MLKKGWKNSGCMCVFITPRRCLEGGGRVRRKGEKVDTHFRPSKDERKRLLDGEKKEEKKLFCCLLSIYTIFHSPSLHSRLELPIRPLSRQSIFFSLRRRKYVPAEKVSPLFCRLDVKKDSIGMHWQKMFRGSGRRCKIISPPSGKRFLPFRRRICFMPSFFTGIVLRR